MFACPDFQGGYCAYGDACCFEHAESKKPELLSTHIQRKDVKLGVEKPTEVFSPSLNSIAKDSICDAIHGEVTRQIAGIKVTFERGAKVKWWTNHSTFESAFHVSKSIISSVARFTLSAPRPYAMLEYSCLNDAQKAARAFRGVIMFNRELHCDVLAADECADLPMPALKISNLHTSVRIDTLKNFARMAKCPFVAGCIIKPHRVDEERAKEAVVSLCAREGHTPKSLSSRFWKASHETEVYVQFNHDNEASESVIALHGQEIPELGFRPLSAHHIMLTEFLVPKAIFRVCQPRIKDESDRLTRSDRYFWTEYAEEKGKVKIRLFGDDDSFMRKEQAVFEDILSGSIVFDGKYPTWHQFFQRWMGGKYLYEIAKLYGGGVCTNPETQTISTYGTTKQQTSLQIALNQKLDEIAGHKWELLLEGKLFDQAVNGGLQRVRSALGKENVSLLYDANLTTLAVRGTPENFQRVPFVLESTSDYPIVDSDSPVVPTATCTVCLSEAMDPFVTRCQHVYCAQCFLNHCTSTCSGTDAVQCDGDEGLCREVFELAELNDQLGPYIFQKLLELSFRGFIQRNPQVLQFCPQPDCGDVYRIHPNVPHWKCRNCFAEICTICRRFSHEGMSCNKNQQSNGQRDDNFEQWKRVNSVKDCPNCKMPLQKAGGCHHIQCEACKAHVCWKCLSIFPTDVAAFDHIHARHQESDDER